MPDRILDWCHLAIKLGLRESSTCSMHSSSGHGSARLLDEGRDAIVFRICKHTAANTLWNKATAYYLCSSPEILEVCICAGPKNLMKLLGHFDGDTVASLYRAAIDCGDWPKRALGHAQAESKQAFSNTAITLVDRNRSHSQASIRWVTECRIT